MAGLVHIWVETTQQFLECMRTYYVFSQ